MLRRPALVPVLFKARPPQYFVSESAGNDNNLGTSPAQAWQTLAKAETSTPANSDLLFKCGDTWDVKGNGAAMFTMPQLGIRIGRYGSGANPVFDGGGTIRTLVSIPANVRDTVTRHLTLYNGGGGTGALWANSGAYNTLLDSVLDTHLDDAGATSGVGAYSVLRRVEILNFADDGFTCHGLNGTGSRVDIYDSVIHDGFDGLNHSVTNGGAITTLCENVTFYSNSSHDIGALDVGNHAFYWCRFGLPGQTQSASIIQVQGLETSVTLAYCLIDATMSDGNAAPSLSNAAPGCTFRLDNCTFRGNAGVAGKTGTINATGGATIEIRNSIFSNWFRLAFIDSATVNADYCLEHLINTGTLTANTNRIGTNATDPLLVDPTNGDFRLQAGSPARNAGITYVGQLTRDYAGNAIQSPPSAGAYEYV